MSDEPAPELSVVIPLYNEVENIPELYRQLTEVLGGMGRPYEIIVVDDGSQDGSFQALAELHARDPRLKVVRFRRNYGQTAGFAAGFERARGQWIVTMDADLQNDPADIPRLITKAEEGYDVVSGWRVRRQDDWLTRKIPSRVANWLIARVTGVYLHDYGCSLKVYHRDVLKHVRLYGEMHRFVPAVASSVGITVAEVPVNHRARTRGRSKYGGLRKTLARTTKVFLDMLTVRFLLSYSTRPIHVFGGLGLVLSGLGVLLGLYLTFEKLVMGHNIGSRPLLLLAILLVILGVQMISMGLLSEMIVRTYFEAQNKPIYVVREELID
ncbi:MAG: glycosyltransferase family 2 protein [Anaerolineae bacterium]|nr:glycosyltransferase family 2 protein [Anaerolineae bacterium]MDW8098330.1 glycosyltransferase family 2 protein [Anaerolineae bacterium]